ncbi:MAG: type I-E CRISPR-associated protein Cas6/Cse3/CasE [Acidobacteria bacterium]|nr:type I-E CRISPR-associated protein Cas6/Cse3/CasE [Acidobacteriota bacterium]
MTGVLYLSRARLRRDASVDALAPLLLGKAGKGSAAQHPGHHLMWSLFADDPDQRRDFLWREMQRGVFLILSARAPQDRHGLFEVAEPKRFTPVLLPGDRLGFSLRANPVVRRRDPERRRSHKHDVVMDALRDAGSQTVGDAGTRAARRLDVVREHGFAWLERQGRKSGFKVESGCVRIDGYEQHRIARKGSAPPMAFSTIDYDGTLTVRDPDALVTAIARGFGASKAYGCGLMLIRRA